MYNTLCLLWWVRQFYLLAWVLCIGLINATLLGRTVFLFMERESWFIRTLEGC